MSDVRDDSEPVTPTPSPPIRQVRSALSSKPEAVAEDRVLCDRCGAEVYRMHAVWRCPACGFKSDCCGW